MNDATTRDLEIDAQLLHAAYDRLRLNVGLTFACIVVFVPLLWKFFPTAVMMASLLALLTNVSVGLWLARAFRRAAPKIQDTSRWRRQFVIYNVLAGASWAVGPAMSYPQVTSPQLVLQVGILLCSSAVIMASVADRAAMQAFLIAALAPPALAAVVSGSGYGVELMVALVLLAGMACLIAVGRRSYGMLRKLLETEYRLRGAISEASAARDIAERNDEAKSNFLSRISHELRTPLHSILGYASLLEEDKKISGQRRDDVQEILKGGRHLLVLINELLDLSAIESGHVQLRPEIVNTAMLIEECRRLVQPLAEAKKISIHADMSTFAAIYCGGDKLRLRQALLNLLSNAIKYNRDGGVIRLSVQSLPGERVRVVVSDTGIGISSGDMAKLFQPYSRVQSASRAVEGSGIGLTITHRLVELMGGTVGVDSQIGVGSQFWIELPVAATAVGGNMETQIAIAPAQQNATGAMPFTGRFQRLLYIDDRLENLRLVQRVLVKRPHIEVTICELPLQGLETARTLKPDLILLDINMPVMDGYHVLAALRSDPELKGIPVIAVTADAMRHDTERGHAAGFNEYLTKPLNMDAFLKTIDCYLPPPVQPNVQVPEWNYAAESLH